MHDSSIVYKYLIDEMTTRGTNATDFEYLFSFAEISNIMIVESGKLIRSKLSVPEEERVGILKLGFDKIKENSIIVDEVLAGSAPTGVFHNFEPGEVAYATISTSGPCKVWLVPGDKFRAVVSKPEYNLIMMAIMAKKIRSSTKYIRGLQDEIKQGDLSAESDKNIVKILSYDSTSWVVDNFNIAVEKFNQENGLQIKMEYTTERLSAKSASYAAGKIHYF